MPGITDLPQNVLDIILGHLNTKGRQSASLTTPTWSQAYKRRCCETISLDLSSANLDDRIALLERWQRLNLLGHVRQISVNDSGERSQNCEGLLQEVFDRWLPKLGGLKHVLWNVSQKKKLEDISWLGKLGSQTQLSLKCEGGVSAQITAEVFSAVRDRDTLRSLTVELRNNEHANPAETLRAILMGCGSMTSLEISVVGDLTASQAVTVVTQETDSESRLHLTAAETARLPCLRHLDIHFPALTGEAFASWVDYGDWSSLRSLKAHHGWTLEHLAGKVPSLESLSVSTLESLHRFLELQPELRELAVLDLEQGQTPSEASSDVQRILTLPCAANLQTLTLRMRQGDDNAAFASIDIGMVASLCPRLKNLTISVGREQHRNAVGFFCWMDACIEAVLRMPKLSRLGVRLPRLISSGTISILPETMVIATASDLWSQLLGYGKKMQEVRIIASMSPEKAESEREEAVLRFLSSVSPGDPALTYIVSPAEKDWDAAKGLYEASCPELEHAEALLLSGRIAGLSLTGDYSNARRTVDDISAFAHNGIIAVKKKPRAMPVWLTPEQEQDRREGPPSQARRAKRALIRGVSEFAGVWRLPMTETSPRTAAERAESRETDIRGRPGWSKSGLATRVFYRR
jgi:hypothetical protein